MAFGRQATAEPVHIAVEDHPDLSRHLEREIQAEITQKTEALVSAKDWADFTQRRGEINGLRAALSLCQHTQARLNG